MTEGYSFNIEKEISDFLKENLSKEHLTHLVIRLFQFSDKAMIFLDPPFDVYMMSSRKREEIYNSVTFLQRVILDFTKELIEDKIKEWRKKDGK